MLSLDGSKVSRDQRARLSARSRLKLSWNVAWRRDEEGQGLIIAAGGLIVAIFVLALVINSGFGLAQRRTMQNAADAGALAAAQLLATSVTSVSGNPPTVFRVTKDFVYCVAWFYADRNRDSFRPDAAGRTETTLVQWSKDITATDPFGDPNGADNANGGTFTAPASPCPTVMVGGQEVPGPVTTGPEVNPLTRFIRVESRVEYHSLVAVVGPATPVASASAVARITGAHAPTSGPTWPMVRHYNPADFTCSSQCNPLTMAPTTFWSATGGVNDKDVVFGSFKGLTDLSRFGPNANRDAPTGVSKNCTGTLAPACVPQLMTDYDHRVITITPPSNPQYGSIGACTNGEVSYPTPPAPSDWWVASGGENSQSWDKDCSLSNWAGYTFAGTLSLGTDWSNAPSPQEPPNDGQPLPSATSTPRRAVCQGVPAGLAAPSCTSGTAGDWIEVAQQSGNTGANISVPLQAYIAANGVYDAYSARQYGNGQNAPLFGKKVVMLVYLWDCSETYTNDGTHTQALRNQWSLNLPRNGSDCSAIRDGNDMNPQDTVSRVHLFTVATFTFYEGTVSSQQIEGYWGGWFNASDPCQLDPGSPQCALNQFANTVFLVGE